MVDNQVLAKSQSILIGEELHVVRASFHGYHCLLLTALVASSLTSFVSTATASSSLIARVLILLLLVTWMVTRVRTHLWALIEATLASTLVSSRSTELDLFPVRILLHLPGRVLPALLVLRVVSLVVVRSIRLLTEIAFSILLVVEALLSSALTLLLALSLLVLIVTASSAIVVLALAIVVVSLSAGLVLVVSLHNVVMFGLVVKCFCVKINYNSLQMIRLNTYRFSLTLLKISSTFTFLEISNSSLTLNPFQHI